jgi:ABC-2 type transport system permease protein
MKKEYSQYKAMMAITRGSLLGIFRSPSAVVFSIAFPLIFILVFGFIGGGSRVSLNVAFDKNTDTTNPIYPALKGIAGINIVKESEADVKEDLERGRVTAVIKIERSGLTNPPYHDCTCEFRSREPAKSCRYCNRS